jgi:4-amino-4-deoxy-L-arabinose transferase-like glycosyltransferase
VYVAAGVLFVVMMSLSGLYGFHRDELYFLDCARHLEAGYVDQPVFTPLLARVSLALFGVSVAGLRLWPSLAGAATVVLAGMLARELGGGRRAQLLAAMGTATAPALLGADHLFGPTAFDLLAWTGLCLLVTRICRTHDRRMWLAAGVVLGLGLANKHSIAFLALALVVGLVLSGGGHLLANRWALAGALVAGLCTVPDLWWQMSHGWATIAMTRQLARENGGAANALGFVVAQLFMATPFLVWLWIGGLRRLWSSPIRPWRCFVWAYGLLFVFFATTTGAKPYYLAGMYPVLLAAGSVRVEEWVSRGAGASLATVGTAVSLAVSLPFVLPVLPAHDIGFVHGLNPTPAETVGWPELVESVAKTWSTLPPAARARAVIFTMDYGEAGAINELGRHRGLPTAVSGQNSEWWWGPGDPRARTVLVVAPGPMDGTGFRAALARDFASVRIVATIGNHAHLDNQESGGHLFLCQDPYQSWDAMWPTLRHYD